MERHSRVAPGLVKRRLIDGTAIASWYTVVHGGTWPSEDPSGIAPTCPRRPPRASLAHRVPRAGGPPRDEAPSRHRPPVSGPDPRRPDPRAAERVAIRASPARGDPGSGHRLLR